MLAERGRSGEPVSPATRGKVSGQRGRGVRLDGGADVFNRDREPGLGTTC